jgi:proline iminopeptidase
VLLDVGDGHEIYWEVQGDPAGKPAVVLHGGPGSGAGPWWGTLFDPGGYRVVLFDQRGCGRSRPYGELSANTTHHLIADIERLREHLGIDRWLVLGGSWGSTLALAYAQAHPERVTEMVLFAVATTTRREIAWLTRDIDLAGAYARLNDPDPAVQHEAAKEWCDWEASHMGPMRRYEDPRFRLCFARLVTHYWRHAAWLEEGQLLRDLDRLHNIPGVLIHGRRDRSSPLEVSCEIAQRWGELIVIEDEGHLGGPATDAQIRRALARFR